MENATKMKIVWLITERGERSYWTRIGVGSVNRDGSITLSLDALPTGSGKLQIRDYTPRDADASEGPEAAPREEREAREVREARGGRGRGREVREMRDVQAEPSL